MAGIEQWLNGSPGPDALTPDGLFLYTPHLSRGMSSRAHLFHAFAHFADGSEG
jgi:hypothetical protein